jgi:mono/diheme cytochrome c family protein
MNTILRTFSIASANRLVLWPAVLAALVLLAAACGSDPEPTATPNTPPSNADPGMEVLITTGCGGCHSIDGLAQASGETGPNLSHVGSKGADYIRESILDPNSVIAQPCPSGECAENVMPQSFGEVLSLGELDDLVAYLSGLQ